MEESELPHAHGDSGSPNRTSAPFCNMGFVPLITHPPKVHPSSPIMYWEPISQNDKHLLLTTTYLLPVPVNTWPCPPSAIWSTTYETFQFPANLNSSIWSFKLNICISLRNPFPRSTNATRIFDTKGAGIRDQALLQLQHHGQRPGQSVSSVQHRLPRHRPER